MAAGFAEVFLLADFFVVELVLLAAFVVFAADFLVEPFDADLEVFVVFAVFVAAFFVDVDIKKN